MRIAYFDCSSGISGDMTLGALIDAGVDPKAILKGIESLRLEGVQFKTSTVIKGGFRSVYIQVIHPEQHAHRHLSDITRLINAADGLTASQKNLALEIFQAVAEAEAHVHGSTIDKVHFHEVGAIDSIVDIVGAAIGFDLLGAEKIYCSPIPTGRGQVRIDHGICTVPTPGTAEILKGIPLKDVPVEAELTTPTGAAIVKTVVDQFGPLPEMVIEKIGYGAGTKDFPNRANVLRIFVGESITDSSKDQVILLETNLDDVSAEVIGYCKEQLLASGALDVYTTSIQMKKNRPGTILSVICSPSSAEAMESILFKETGTLGIRRTVVERSVQSRESVEVNTPWGTVRGKVSWRSGESRSFTPEFEDCARLARENEIPLREVYRSASSLYEPAESETPAVHSHDHDHDHRHDHDHDHHHDHDHDH